MKRSAALFFVCIMAILGLHTHASDAASVGLFADAGRSVMSASGPGQFSLYVWWLPGDSGLKQVRFILNLPANVEWLNGETNPAFEPLLGCGVTCPGPMVLCSSAYSCQFVDWVWTDRIDCLILDAAPSVIEVAHCPKDSVLLACPCGRIVYDEPVVILNKFGLNREPVIAVDESTWGAIKSLYR